MGTTLINTIALLVVFVAFCPAVLAQDDQPQAPTQEVEPQVTEQEEGAQQALEAGQEADNGAEPQEDTALPEAEGAQEAEPLLEPHVPGLEYADSNDPEPMEDMVDLKPFSRGDMEVGPVLGVAGFGGDYMMILGGMFAYYVVNHLAPGIEITYTTDFGSAGYADSVRMLPFLKFVILRSTSFAPYIFVAGGREFQWGSDFAVHSWILGPGFGAHVGVGKFAVLNLQVLFLHYWYDDPMVVRYRDSDIFTDETGKDFLCGSDGICDLEVDDKKDLNREWIYPVLSIGVSFMF